MTSLVLSSYHDWLQDVLSCSIIDIHLLQGDASQRLFYRVKIAGASYILMDSSRCPLAIKDYISITKKLQLANFPVPEIYFYNLDKCWFLISDFGNTWLAKHYRPCNNNYYKKAIDILLGAQSNTLLKHEEWPKYDDNKLLDELILFPKWYCEVYQNAPLSNIEQEQFQHCCHILLEQARSQPQTWVHRDYHSRNIMVLGKDALGIIDYQDAVWGPISYDLVSLLRDCYYCFDSTEITYWLDYYFQQAVKLQLLGPGDRNALNLWFDNMGIQRHLKVLGIFSRLAIRDNKPQFLADIPRVYTYIMHNIRPYKELQNLYNILKVRIPTISTTSHKPSLQDSQ
jgi:N-acetylmuramate 1-kinase